MPRIEKTYTIPVGQTTSGSIFLNEGALTGIVVSGSIITGTTLSFLVSSDGVSFNPLYDSDSAEVSLAVSSASPRSYALNPTNFMGWNVVKLRLGTAASSVAQANNELPIVAIIDNLL